MIALIYRCRAKAMNVQRWFANEARQRARLINTKR
jgi:hypothetical protein